ncbi:hypothetical protein DK842_12735 [Chromobacterium phragmitis]|uniref:bifunctional diguanylate cyclase/phosphodiesterase n=1 Tax=Chromobacterium phragmitis TaxID=2202141 RepID=UPI000DEC6E21|nr:EAL domain-containing protein [Chromobacterium phragmitis]AXE30683.1 hypothetical protein DK842_12735 [Chromobacterium phragmitis]
MEADSRRLRNIMVMAYVLIAAVWIVVPDMLAIMGGEEGGVAGGLVWDALFVFVTAVFLYLLLRGRRAEDMAGLKRAGAPGRALLRLASRGPAPLIALYAVSAMLILAAPELLWSRLLDSRLYFRVIPVWDLAFIAGSGALLRLCLDSEAAGDRGPEGGKRFVYLFALASSLLMLFIRFQLSPQFSSQHLMLLFLIPIGLSALLGGLGPGLLATFFIAASIAYLFAAAAPDMPAHPAVFLLSLSLLVLVGTLLSVMSEVQLRARARLAQLLSLQADMVDALGRSEERFRALFDDSPVAMAISRLEDGAIVEANRAFLELLGLERMPVQGSTTRGLGIWADIKDRTRLFDALRKDGEVKGAPVRLLRSDGAGLDVLLSFRLIQLGGVDHVHGVALDVSDRQRAQLALQDSEARLAGMVRSAMDGIITVDEEQRIVLFNVAAEQIFGRRAEDMLGQPLEGLLPASMRSSHRQMMRSFGERGVSARRMGRLGKVQGMRADGQLFDLEASISTLEVGGRRSYTVILRDISERERAQAETLRHMQQLESLNDLNRAILTANDAEQIALIGLRSLRRLVPFWGATAMLIDWEGGFAKVLAIERVAGAGYDPGQRLSLISYGMDDLERMKKGEPCLVGDLATVSRRPLTLERLYQQGVQSYVRIPLMAEGRLLGMLNLVSDAQGAFDEAQLEVAQAYARQLAICLQQSLLRQHVARLGRVYEVLSRINALIVRCRDREALFDGICKVALEIGAYRMAWAGVIDEDTQNGTVVAFRGEDSDYLRQIRLSAREDFLYKDRPACRAVRLREMVVCNDVQGDPSLYSQAAELQSHGVRAVACLPILLDDKAVAVVALFAGDVGAFDRQETTLLRELASDVGYALDHIRKEERLHYLAYYDSLTGLANRSLLGERLAQHMSDVAVEGRRFSVAVFDLENFKSINDVLGRVQGDKALQLLTKRLALHAPDASLLARLGADRFALGLPLASGEEEAALALELVRQNCLDAPIVLDGNELRLSAKFGLAIYPDDADTATSLLERAESALKRAKAGGEKFLFYRQEMTDRAAAVLEMGSRLRQALEREQFELHYQPKFAAKGHALAGVEALLRWRCPERGMVSPAQFVPMLEELGLIVEVGDWVVRQAARDFQAWRAAGLDAPRIAVNVSPLQLRQADFAQSLAAALGMPADQAGIDIEITESHIMADVDSSIATLRQVRDLGVSIALDDFGTGYSSLAYLARLPVQTLKIDRAFVSRMQEEEEAMTLVEMIVSLAHSMDLEVVAEGVETESQAQVLEGLGCDVLQGYWLSRPVPAAELAARLAAGGGGAA